MLFNRTPKGNNKVPQLPTHFFSSAMKDSRFNDAQCFMGGGNISISFCSAEFRSKMARDGSAISRLSLPKKSKQFLMFCSPTSSSLKMQSVPTLDEYKVERMQPNAGFFQAWFLFFFCGLLLTIGSITSFGAAKSDWLWGIFFFLLFLMDPWKLQWPISTKWQTSCVFHRWLIGFFFFCGSPHDR